MMVYGDLKFEEELRSIVSSLRAHAAKVLLSHLEDLRTLMIQCGQLEQAVEDRWSGEPTNRLLQLARDATQHAADAFFALWTRAAGESAAEAEDPENSLAQLKEKLAGIECVENPMLQIKVPEGFAFYALFPEQYCASFTKWAEEHRRNSPKRALVVGIRSIGTTLSPLGCAALRALGWEASRLTVRPSGHPFQRRVQLEVPNLSEASCALIVDEGPGLSGSSMAAVAEWLRAAGVSDIGFFPGHQGEPGPAATAEVRRCWAETPRYFTRIEDFRWHGSSMLELLCSQIGGGKVCDLSGGEWRRWSFDSEKEWPAVCASLERMKILSENSRGDRVFWKFAGLGCLVGNGETDIGDAMQRINRLAKEELTPCAIAKSFGFVATPWIEGVPLRASDANEPTVLEHITDYIRRSAGPVLSDEQARSAIERLAEMLYWNTREALGEKLAERMSRLADRALALAPTLSYGDGRMAPHEWVRTASGKIFKTDCAGHDRDHTLIGQQSMLWDVAGVMIEWDLRAEQTDVLLGHFRRNKMQIDQEALAFYCVAYAAFRIGMMSLAQTQLSRESPEEKRVALAREYYKSKVIEVVSWKSVA